MTEQNQNALNEEYDVKMTLKYEGEIKNGNLEIGNWLSADPEVTSLRFVEKFDIQTLLIYISSDMIVQLRSSTLKELSIFNEREYDQDEKQKQRLNMQVDDLELENLEVLDLRNSVKNDQLYNLAKFKKLHTLNVSRKNVDLTHSHNVISLTRLYMVSCELKNIDQITSLVNLQELDISSNEDLDLSPLCKLKYLSKLSMYSCGLKNIDQIAQLTNLDVLEVSYNQLKNINSIYLLVNLKELNISQNKQIDITPLKDLVGLVKLVLGCCNTQHLSALKPLINLQDLDISCNPNIIITELQYLKNLTHLNLEFCYLVSVYVLRPLMNLEYLNISHNKIVHLDAHLNEMKRLETLIVENNRISDFSSLEKHSNYNNIDDDDRRCFNISDQKDPSNEQLFKANKFRKIERPNIQLKEIQIPHKSLKPTFSNFKQEINAAISNARQSQIQFTANVVRLFQQLNQFGFE
ncbi:leucine-rich_repeat domain-containing protein [Hexamita inflata]|uniref:Leucine-rich repeat domain-containing protein n=1 Tax=Hexamita inflata TaxID=28002 RepID=A0AA86QZG5_9EUKA|nr:leucine-rich repeat domain-containing protein [Hexamita inflata]